MTKVAIELKSDYRFRRAIFYYFLLIRCSLDSVTGSINCNLDFGNCVEEFITAKVPVCILGIKAGQFEISQASGHILVEEMCNRTHSF